MSSDSCVNDITISLYFDIPNNALDGEYVVYMREDASRIVLLKSTYNYFWDDYDLNEFQKYDSLYRHGVIYVS